MPRELFRPAANALKAQYVQANMDGTPRTTLRAPVQSLNLAGMPEFQALPPTVRTRLEAYNNNPEAADQLNILMHQPLYDQLSTEQRTKLLDVFAGASPEARQELIALMDRKLDGGVPALLSTDNSGTGATLLDNLDKLANQPLAPAVAGRRSEILSDVIKETAEPTWYVDQGDASTCAPTSLQTHLVLNAPAEYARIMGGLLGPDRSVTLANGDKMGPTLNYLASPPTVTKKNGNAIADTRSLTERVFQSSLAQYAYSNSGRPLIVNANGDIPGLGQEGTATALSGLYGGSYKAVYAHNNIAIDTRPDLYGDIVDQLAKGNRPVPVALNWGDGAHEVLVDKIEKGPDGKWKVYFRNPWGSSEPTEQGVNYKSGQVKGTADNDTKAGPQRTVVDQYSGLEVMSASDFIKALHSAVI